MLKCNQFKMNTHGLSTVVATVLVLSITIAAVALIAQFVLPFVKDSLQRSSECFDYEELFSFDETFDYNCYESDKIIISVNSRQSKTGELPAGFNLVLIKQGASLAVKVVPDSPPAGLKMIDDTLLVIPSGGETRTYNYTISNAGEFRRAEIYTILKNGRVCEKKSDYINIISCMGRT